MVTCCSVAPGVWAGWPLCWLVALLLGRRSVGWLVGSLVSWLAGLFVVDGQGGKVAVWVAAGCAAGWVSG